MAKKSGVTVSLDKLHELVESLRNKPHIEVGVFARKDARREEGPTNADIASAHEYGSPKHGLPPRSFLWTPIKENAAKIMAVARGKADELLNKGGTMKLWKAVGVAAEVVVDGAFDSGGYGKWAPLKYSTLLAKSKGSLKKRKGTLARIYAGQVGMGILIDTTQLRHSISSRVRMAFR